MKVSAYSEDFKKTAVTKYLSRGNRSGSEVISDLGISNATIFSWVKKYGKTEDMSKKSKRPKDRNGPEKVQLVISYFSLPETERGKFLREQGLHSSHLEQWRAELESGQKVPSKRS